MFLASAADLSPSGTEPALQVLAYTVRLALALLVALVAYSDWRRTRREGHGHLALAFGLGVLQQVALLFASAGVLSGRSSAFWPVLEAFLEAAFLITLIHALALRDAERRPALQSVTRLLLQANVLAYALVQFAWYQWLAAGQDPVFAHFWGSGFYELWDIGLLMLAIYLSLALEPQVSSLPALVMFLLGDSFQLAEQLIGNDQLLYLRLADLILPVLGFLGFLFAAHVGMVRETQTDPLTGMGNRRYFLTRVATEFEKARRKGKPLAVLVLDLDYFKRYNDTYGHLAGDELLREAARSLHKNLRNGDQLSRWGGEEFICLLPGANRQQAVMVAERLRKSVASLPLQSERDAKVTISIGVATYPESATTWEDLVDRADRTLYEAKRFRNRVAVYAPEAAAESQG